MEKIIVLITRVNCEEGQDDWVENFGFDQEKVLVVIDTEDNCEYLSSNKLEKLSKFKAIIIHGNEKFLEEANSEIKNCVKKIFKYILEVDVNIIARIHPGFVRYNTKEALKVILHHIYEKVPQNMLEELDKKFEYFTSNNENIKLIISKLNPSQSEVEKGIVEKLAEVLEKETIIPSFSLLKHRIAHLWLPLDIDLQGIMECRKDGRRGKRSHDDALNYLKEVLGSKNGDTQYYRQKLADLQYIIAGSKFIVPSSKSKERDNPCKDAKPVEHSDKIKKFMNGKEPILELVEDGKNEKNKDEIEKLKDTLLILAGLKTNNYEPDTDSPIFKFMCLLDCGIKDEKHRDIEEILGFFGFHKFIDEKGSEKKLSIGGVEKPIISFHDWFCALDECLYRLREKIR